MATTSQQSDFDRVKRWGKEFLPALWCRSLVLVSCGLLAAGLLTSCTSHSTAAAAPHPRPATAERVHYDLTGQPYFETPDGNITCGLPFFHWSNLSPPSAAGSQQAVICRIKKYTVPPPAACKSRQDGGTPPGVLMEPYQYASFTCLNVLDDQDMIYEPAANGGAAQPRNPYHAHSGQDINLGPVICFVQTSSVDCTSTTAPRTFHLDPDSFRSPLSPADSVLAAENRGSPDTPASTAVVRPSTYQSGNNTVFSNITWNQWDSATATGTATYRFNTCTPNCAAGNYQTDQNVTISFTDPMIVCGRWFFTELTVHDPAAPSDSGTIMIAPDSYDSMTTPDCLPPSTG